MSAEEKCIEILKARDLLAHNLKPHVLPRGFDDRSLMSLCKSKEHKLELGSCIQEYEHKISSCSICKSDKEDDKPFSFCTEWAINPEEKTIQLFRLLFLCESCEIIFNLETFLEHCFDNDVSEASVKHFASVNNLTGSIANQTIVLEQCVSLSYSLKVIYSNFPRFVMLDHEGKVFGTETSFKEIFQWGFSGSKSTKVKTSKSPRKKNKKQ